MHTLAFRGLQDISITAVEILKLKGVPRATNLYSGEYRDESDGILAVHTCEAAEAARLAELWNSLPYGMQARCHSPGYAIRVYERTEVAFVAAICWACNNVSIAGSKATESSLSFLASSPEGQSLLQFCSEKFD